MQPVYSISSTYSDTFCLQQTTTYSVLGTVKRRKQSFPINPFEWHVRNVARPRNMNLGAWQTRTGAGRTHVETHTSHGRNNWVHMHAEDPRSRVYAYASPEPSATRLWAVCMGITLLMYEWSGAVYGICRRSAVARHGAVSRPQPRRPRHIAGASPSAAAR